MLRCVLCLCLGVFINHSVMGPCCYLCLYMSEKNFPPPTTPLIIWRDGGGNNFLYYIEPCRPNVVNTAERTVTRNCITFATISFLFISAVCVVLWFDFFSFPLAAPVPMAARGLWGRPFPLCQPVFRLVSAITPRLPHQQRSWRSLPPSRR